ncbi:MAG: arylsulfatase [Rikenellaceae bacterium]
MNQPLLYTSLVTLGAAAAMSSCSGEKELPTRPNIIYILADDLGYGDTGVYGADKIKTPNIDRLASQGRRFTDAHSASAVSTPSRYALLTGEYPFRGVDPTQSTTGLYGPLNPQAPLIIDTDELSMPEMLQRSGYKTACIGKWHLGWGVDVPDWNAPLKPGPVEVGFDYCYCVPLVNSGPPYFYVENSDIVGYDPTDPIYYVDPKSGGATTPINEYPDKVSNRYSGGTYAHSLYIDEGGGELLLDKALTWLDKNKEEPFFLYFATTHIHHPFTPTERFKGSSEAGIYGDFAQELDWIVGEMMAYLDANGLADNTIVVFTSDNGGMMNKGGQEAFENGHRINGDLLGYKFGIWEGGHRIPFIVRWPDYVEANTVSDETICLVDMFATFADIVDYDLAEGDAPDSYNVLESWVGSPKSPIRDYLVMSPRSAKHVSLRMGDWLYIPTTGAGGFSARPWGSHGLGSEAATIYTGQVNSDIVDGRVRKDAPKAQLYNLSTDTFQTTNVILENPEIAETMAAKLAQIREGSHTRVY